MSEKKYLKVVQNQHFKLSHTGKLAHTLFVLEHLASGQSLVVNRAELAELLTLAAGGIPRRGQHLKVSRNRDLLVIESLAASNQSLVVNRTEAAALAKLNLD